MDNDRKSSLTGIFCVCDAKEDVTHSQSSLFVCFLINRLRLSVFDIGVAAADGRRCLFSDELTGGLLCMFSLVCLCVGDRGSSQC